MTTAFRLLAHCRVILVPQVRSRDVAKKWHRQANRDCAQKGRSDARGREPRGRPRSGTEETCDAARLAGTILTRTDRQICKTHSKIL